eukprot:3985553-Lingulodinium_polyedra.AAC.1
MQTCIRFMRRRAYRNSRTPCVNHHAVVDAWSAQIAKCGAPHQWNAMPWRAIEQVCARDRSICEWISRTVRLRKASRNACDRDPDH